MSAPRGGVIEIVVLLADMQFDTSAVQNIQHRAWSDRLAGPTCQRLEKRPALLFRREIPAWCQITGGPRLYQHQIRKKPLCLVCIETDGRKRPARRRQHGPGRAGSCLHRLFHAGKGLTRLKRIRAIRAKEHRGRKLMLIQVHEQIGRQLGEVNFPSRSDFPSSRANSLSAVTGAIEPVPHPDRAASQQGSKAGRAHNRRC